MEKRQHRKQDDKYFDALKGIKDEDIDPIVEGMKKISAIKEAQARIKPFTQQSKLVEGSG